MKKKLCSLGVACAMLLSVFQCTLTAMAQTDQPNYTNNLLRGLLPSANVPLTYASYCTDGSKNTYQNMHDSPNEGVLWVQFDLGRKHELGRIGIWHYFEDARTYYDVIVQVSNDPEFKEGVVTVFNNDADNSSGQGKGTDAEYTETAEGKLIDFEPVKARYIRLYSKGNSVNVWNHYVEVEAYAPYEEAPEVKGTVFPNAKDFLLTPTPDGYNQITQPDVTYIPEGLNGYKYYMATTSFANNQGSAENPIVLVSNDGIDWTAREPENLLPDPVNGSWYQDPDIVYTGEELRLYYYQEGGTNDGNIGWVKMLRSADGENWQLHDQPIYTSSDYKYGSFGLSVVAEQDGSFSMWAVNAHNQGWCGTDNRVVYRTSPNGIDSWSETQDLTASVVPQGYQPWHLNVEYIPEKQEYWMLLAAYPTSTPDSNNCELFFSRSKDGVNWQTYPEAVLKANPDKSAWDAGCVYRSTFVYDAASDTIKVWYGGRNSGLTWHVGYTEATYASLFSDAEQPQWDTDLEGGEVLYQLHQQAQPLEVEAWSPDDGEISYQWFCNGTPIAGATGNTYTPSTEQAGEFVYSCTATNTNEKVWGSTTAELSSAEVVVKVAAEQTAEAPRFTKDLASADSASYRKNAQAKELTVQAEVSDGGSVSYQWYRDGKKLDGATDASLRPATDALGKHTYSCVATNTLDTGSGVKTAQTESQSVEIIVSEAAVKEPAVQEGAPRAELPAGSDALLQQLLTEQDKTLLDQGFNVYFQLVSKKAVLDDSVSAALSGKKLSDAFTLSIEKTVDGPDGTVQKQTIAQLPAAVQVRFAAPAGYGMAAVQDSGVQLLKDLDQLADTFTLETARPGTYVFFTDASAETTPAPAPEGGSSASALPATGDTVPAMALAAGMLAAGCAAVILKKKAD